MNQIVDTVSQYVQQFFHEHIKSELTYHNLAHTRNVVAHAKEMIQHYELSDTESDIIQIAAWFHDIGYLTSGAYEHEKVGVEIMRRFIADYTIASADVEQIAGCIMATKIPTTPKTLLEEILCDADAYHLGTNEFFEADEAVKKEFAQSTEVSDFDWNMMTLRFLERHSYFTDYCKERLNIGKEANMGILRIKIYL